MQAKGQVERVGSCNRVACEKRVFWFKNPKPSGRGSVSVNIMQEALDSGSVEFFGVV